MSFPASKRTIAIGKMRSRSLKSAKPQITSLVDIMTILVFFLVKSFSSEGEIMTLSADLQLPESSSKTKPHPTVILAVSNKKIMADGVAIVSIDEILKTNSMVIPQLAAWLMKRKEITEKIAERSSTLKFEGNVTIQGDRKIPFEILKRVMFTSGQIGYSNFSLAVIQNEG